MRTDRRSPRGEPRKEMIVATANARAGRLMAAGLPAFLTGHLLFRADQDLFGAPSDFLAGFLLVTGVAVFIVGLSVSVRSRHNDPR